MKNFYFIFALLASSLFINTNAKAQASMMEDTITLTLGGGSAAVGDQLCLPVYGANFNDIVGFQWQVQYDPNIFIFNKIISHPDLEGLTSNTDILGIIKLLYFATNIVSPFSTDSLPIFELCFDVISDADVPTHLSISDDGFPIEIINSELSDIHVNVVSESIFIENNLDCGLILYCPVSVEYVFSPDMVIHKKDFIEGYDQFLNCYNYKDEDVKLINMSAPRALPADSLIMTCENVYHNTTIGVVLMTTSQEVKEGDTTITTASFLVCKTHVVFNIPDHIIDCTNTVRSCIDPLRCKTYQVEITENLTVIDYSSIVESSGKFAICDATLYSNFESIATIPDEYPNGFALYCSDYKPEIEVLVSIEATIAENNIFVAPEWCSSLIEMTGISKACKNDSFPAGAIPVSVNENVSNVKLNGTNLSQNSDSLLFFMPESSLQQTDNEISIDGGAEPGLFNISTLDLVMQYKILISEETTAAEAIASDVDLSGSLTTKDIRLLRFNILGINQDDFLNKNFILEKKQNLGSFNFLNFDNDYETYTFSKADIDIEEGLHFEIFKYGDVSNATSSFHKSIKSNELKSLSLPDLYVKKGQLISVPVTIASDAADPLVALDVALDIRNFDFENIEHNYRGGQLLHLHNNGIFKLAFFNIDNQKDFEATIVLRAKKSGHLSDILSIHNKAVNEAVTDNLETTTPILIFEEVVIFDKIQVYPNPVYDNINISIPKDKIGATINIYNALGQLMVSQITKDQKHQIDINEHHLNGIIHVAILDENSYSSVTIVALQ
ncbi:MAG: T9SS type A sorting domain-containing protein [Saprospiraceae bacterium]